MVRPCTIHEHFQSDVGGERDNALKMAFDTKSKTLRPRNEQDMVDVMMTIKTVDDLATSLLQDIYNGMYLFFYFGLFLKLMYKMQCTLIYYYILSVNFPKQTKLLSSSIAVSTRDFESRIHGIRA